MGAGGMATDLPTTLLCRFGITTYQLSDQDLLHPGELVDRLVRNTDLCRSGAFVVSIHMRAINGATHSLFILEVAVTNIKLFYYCRVG
jgi:hypothetical protein